MKQILPLFFSLFFAFVTPSQAIPEISIQDNSGQEFNQNNKVLLQLSEPSPVTVRVRIRTDDETANWGFDYARLNNQLVTIPANLTTYEVYLVIAHDLELTEPDETFKVTIHSPENATIADNEATFTIINTPFYGPCAGVCRGDLNRDQLVDGADLQLMTDVILGNVTEEFYQCRADIFSPTSPTPTVNFDDVAHLSYCLVNSCTCEGDPL